MKAWRHNSSPSSHTASRLLKKASSFLKVKRQLDSEYLSQHRQSLPFLCGAVKMFSVVIHPGLTEFPNCVLKQQLHNLQLSDAVASFGFLPLRGAGFFGVDSLNRKNKHLSFPKHHWIERTKLRAFRIAKRKRLNMTTQLISREKKAYTVSNLRCGWSCQTILTP